MNTSGNSRCSLFSDFIDPFNLMQIIILGDLVPIVLLFFNEFATFAKKNKNDLLRTSQSNVGY